jgi:hypothetical protein
MYSSYLSVCMCFLCTGYERAVIRTRWRKMVLYIRWYIYVVIRDRIVLDETVRRPKTRYVISASTEASGYLACEGVKLSAKLQPRAHDASGLAQVKSWGCASKRFMEAMRSPAGCTWNRIDASIMRHARAPRDATRASQLASRTRGSMCSVHVQFSTPCKHGLGVYIWHTDSLVDNDINYNHHVCTMSNI